MNWLRKRSIHKDRTDDYMTSEDVRKVFTENIDSLYLLALLLTGDQEKAEQCFVAGVEDSVNANDAFRQWAHTWAKRAIIQDAIRAMHPSPDTANFSAENAPRTDNNRLTIEDPHLDAVLALQDFNRFVFVMSVLERYSDDSCAVLLGCSVQDIRRARTEAVEQLTKFLRIAHLDERKNDEASFSSSS